MRNETIAYLTHNKQKRTTLLVQTITKEMRPVHRVHAGFVVRNYLLHDYTLARQMALTKT